MIMQCMHYLTNEEEGRTTLIKQINQSTRTDNIHRLLNVMFHLSAYTLRYKAGYFSEQQNLKLYESKPIKYAEQD